MFQELKNLDRTDPEDLEDLVYWLFNKSLLVFFVGTSIIMVVAILKTGNGSLPPEPQWWVEFRTALFTWLF